MANRELRGQVRGLRKRSFILRDPESWHAGWNDAIDAVLALLDAKEAEQAPKEHHT